MSRESHETPVSASERETASIARKNPDARARGGRQEGLRSSRECSIAGEARARRDATLIPAIQLLRINLNSTSLRAGMKIASGRLSLGLSFARSVVINVRAIV